jgi:hypothetical protein
MIRVVAAANPYRFLHSRVAPGFSPAPLRLDTQLPRGAACPARLCTGTHFVAAHHAAPMLGNSFASQRPRDTAISNGAGRRFFFRAASVSQHRHFERSRPTFFLSGRVRFTAPSFRTEQADVFSFPPRLFHSTVISNGAGRRFFFRAASVSQHRHFERSRPIFSSASLLRRVGLRREKSLFDFKELKNRKR